jgi:tetratricopeptide (TPR) repeat protein
VIWIYIRLFVFPVGQNVDYGIPHSRSLLDPFAVLGLAGLMALLFIAWKFRSKYPLASLGVTVFLILLSPTSSVIPIADAAAERRAYLPSIGLLLVLVEFLRRWRGPKWKNVLICLVISALAVGTWSRNNAFGSAVAIWEDSVHGNPQNFRSWVQLGVAYVRTKRCSEAVNAFEHAEKLGHLEQGLYLDYAAAFECDGQIDRAAAEYRRAIAVFPRAHTWTSLAALFERQGRWDEAFDALDQAEKLDPTYWEVYSFRGSAYLELGRVEEAAAEYRHALALRPNDEFALAGLSKADTAIRFGRGKRQPLSK